MRGYVAVTPAELQGFLRDGYLPAPTASIVAVTDSDTAEDEEELEFEASWKAAEESKVKQSSLQALGLVLAVDLDKDQCGPVRDAQVEVLSNILWPQVQSLLLSDSEEPELSWFAPQEISTYLPQWLA